MTAERTKRCPRCEIVKPWDDFHAKVKWPDGSMRQPHSYCKPCHNAYGAETARKRWHADREWARERMLKKTKAEMTPEAYAIHLSYRRDWTRRKRGTLPENFRDPSGDRVMVEVAPIYEAVQWAGIGWGELAARVNMDPSSLRRTLTEQSVTRASIATKVLEALGLSPVDVDL